MRKFKHFLTALVLLIFLPASLYAQKKMISGVITDAKGSPLISASIIVANSTSGTTTDAQGKFKLTVSENASIIISAVGYKSQTFKVSEVRGDLNVKLEEDIGKLEEVVVTGLAIQKLLAADQIDFTIDQQPYLQGFIPILQLFMYQASQTLSGIADTNTGLKFLDKTTVVPYNNTKSRYEGTSSATGLTKS